MTRWMAGFIIVLPIVFTASAQAQETTPGPGKAEVTIIPGGMTFFTEKKHPTEDSGTRPSFNNYDLGGAIAINFSRVVGVEGEVGGSLGLKQDLLFGGLTMKEKTPNMLSYSGNVVVNAPGHSVVPYATGGVGGLTVYDRAALGITNTDTFLTGNAGGGVKWFAGKGRWGLRGDYRFQVVRSNSSTAPDFFGRESRFGHRIYGAVIINAVR